jgi:uncharacterized protein (DUF427 family)
MKAIWNGTLLAECNDTVIVEGNHYFPPESVKQEYLTESLMTTVCPWKGTANYYNLEANGKTLKDGAWYYKQPKEAANQIKDHIAFYTARGVQVLD